MRLISDGGIVSCNIPDTVDAIMLSKNINYLDGVKLDVRMSYDCILVLSVSDNLSDITYSNKKISEETYDYLRKVKFPSHIFKYYIPTLYEILKRFNHEKLIVLELYPAWNNERYLNCLYKLLYKFKYQFYFLTEDADLLEIIKNSQLVEIGTILEKNDYEKIDSYSEYVPTKKDIFIISKYPEKIHKHMTYFDNNTNI